MGRRIKLKRKRVKELCKLIRKLNRQCKAKQKAALAQPQEG